MVEDEPAVVADGGVALRAGAEALLSRRHPFFMFVRPAAAINYVGASFYTLTAPHLSTQFLRLPGMFKGPQLRDVLKLLYGSVQMCFWPCVKAWMPFDPCPSLGSKASASLR